jgi:hypothetical protein
MNSLPVPLHKQRQAADCLPACVAMVLDFLGQPADYDSLLRALGTTIYVAAPLAIPTGDFELAWLEMGNRYIVFEPTAPSSPTNIAVISTEAR